MAARRWRSSRWRPTSSEYSAAADAWRFNGRIARRQLDEHVVEARQVVVDPLDLPQRPVLATAELADLSRLPR